jgi:hypothetical protein
MKFRNRNVADPAALQNFEQIEGLVGSAAVSRLPRQPSDGQEVFYLADDTQGVVWHLKYRGDGGTYRWEFVGGSPLAVAASAAQAITTTGYASLGLSITPPLDGDYMVEWGLLAYGSEATMREYKVKPSQGLPINDAFPVWGLTNNVSGFQTPYRRAAYLALVAGTPLTVYGKNSVGSLNTQCEGRTLAITPIRVR